MIEHLLNFEIHAHKMTNNTVISNILNHFKENEVIFGLKS